MSKKNKIAKGFRFFLIFAVFTFACGKNQFSPEDKHSNSSPSATNIEMTEIQREIKAMETADFNFIFVIKRKDGGVFDKADRDFLRENRTPEINRYSTTEDKTAFIVGSNYEFIPKHWENLQKRFVIEDYSKPKQTEIHANQNVNK